LGNAAINVPVPPVPLPIQQTPHITQTKKEDINKFGGHFNQPQQASLNPLMSDLLKYLQQAY